MTAKKTKLMTPKVEVVKSEDQKLSLDSIKSEGISIQVNQNDVVDLIVHERWESLMSEIEKYNTQYRNLQKDVEDEIEAYISCTIVDNKYPKGIIIIKRHLQPANYIGVRHISVDTEKKSKTFDLVRDSVISKAYKLRIDLQTTIKSIVFEAREEIEIKFELSKALISKIERHNNDIEEFHERIKDLTEAKILKIMKAAVTKEILKTTSPDFRKTLRDKFNLDV